MPDIKTTYHLDVSRVQDAFAQVEAMGKRAAASVSGAGGGAAFRSQQAGAAKAAQSFAVVRKEADAAGQAAARSAGFVDRFASRVRRAGAAAGAVSAIVVALVALNRRFPVIGQVAAKSFAVIQQTATAAMTTTGKFAVTLGHLHRAAGAAVAIYGLAKAFRTLRGSAQGAGDLKVPKAPSMPGMGLAGKLGIAGAALGGIGLLAGFGDMVKDGLSKAIRSAAEMEQVEIGFEVLTGGPDQAKALLGEIRDLAATTPLEFGDLAVAGRQLLAFKEDAETLPDTLRRIGDISSGIGAPVKEIAEIYGKARVQGTLFAEDINQLTGRGIDVISEFADQLGVGTDQVKKMASEGKVAFPMLEEAFRSLTDEGGTFAGMMARQATTVMGLWSSLKDNVEMAFQALGAPVNDSLRGLLERAVELSEDLEGRFAAVGERIAEAVNFVRAFFSELSAGEMVTALGDALQVAILKALDLLARGAQTVMGLFGDTSFMDALGEKLRSFGAVLKDALLGAVEAMILGLSQVKGLGFLEDAALKMSQDRAKQRARERDRQSRSTGGEDGADLGARIKERWEQSEGVFGTLIGKFEGRLGKTLEPVWAEAQRLLAEQQAGSGEEGGGGKKRSGEMIATAGASVAAAGAFQQAKNLLAGKTVNELVAQEAAKTNDQLGKVVAGQDRMRTAIEKVEKAVLGKKTPVEVEVVPTF